VRYGGRAIPFERLDEYLPRADIVISSTGAPHFVIRPDAVQRAINVRRGRPVLMVDIAVPRDIDPAAGGIENVYVYAIDDLKRVAEENLSRRRDAVEQAWRIVRQGTAEVAPLVDGGGLQDLLRRLDEQGREASGHALRRALDRGELAGLPASAREEIRVLANRIVNRMLAEPRRALRRAAGTAAWEDYARVVNDLFGFRHGEGEDGTAAGETSGKDKEREPA
jgi:glutamyl-tRNA reductase